MVKLLKIPRLTTLSLILKAQDGFIMAKKALLKTYELGQDQQEAKALVVITVSYRNHQSSRFFDAGLVNKYRNNQSL